MLAATRAFRPHWWAHLLGHPCLLLGAGCAILAGCVQFPLFSQAGAVVLFPLVACACACLLAGALSPAAFIGRVALPGVRPIATLAFGLYLTHKQVYALLDGWLPGLGARGPWLAGLVYAAASVAVAGLLYLAVERPALGLRERLLARARAAASDGAPVGIGRA